MGKSKKTFSVEIFKNYVNKQLKRTDGFATDEFKSGLCLTLEQVLHESNNYNGYQDLYWDEIGFNEWSTTGGRTEEWEKKKLFIYGTSDSKYSGSKHARVYY